MARVLHILPHRGGGAETYIDALEEIAGLEHRRVALSRGRTPLSAAFSLPAGYPSIARAARNAELVHAHGDVAAMLALALLRARPSVVTTHGLHFLRRSTGARRAAVVGALRAVARSAACVLCTSQAEHDELAALLGARSAQRLRTVHNGIAPPPPVDAAARAAARAQLGLTDGDVAALFLGELEPRKAPLVAVAAARRAASDGAPLVLLVAGDGPQAEAVRASQSCAIRPLGFRRDPERLLAAADIFVLPSEREGLSFAVLEAMGQGLAMVVCDGPGNPEAVGEAGIVVPAGDVGALAAALAALARDPARRALLGDAARERVAAQFTRERMLAGIAEAYAAALTSAP